MSVDPNVVLQRQYEAEQQLILLEAKEAAHKFFDAMSKLDSEYFAKLIDELAEDGLMRQIVNARKDIDNLPSR